MSTDYDDFVTVTKLEIDTDVVRQAGTSLGEVDQILSQARTHLESLWREVEDSYNFLNWEFDLTGAGGDTGLNVAGAYSHLQSEVDDLALGPGSRLDTTRVRGEEHSGALIEAASQYERAENIADEKLQRAFERGQRAVGGLSGKRLFQNWSHGVKGVFRSHSKGVGGDFLLDDMTRTLGGFGPNLVRDHWGVGENVPLTSGFAGTGPVTREQIAELYGTVSSFEGQSIIQKFADVGIPGFWGVRETAADLRYHRKRDYGVRLTRVDNQDDYDSTNGLTGLMEGISSQYAKPTQQDMEDDYEPGNVTVDVLADDDGNESAVVYIAGTRHWDVNARSPFDVATNVDAISGDETLIDDAVRAALEHSGVDSGTPVTLAGHSQGGIVAQNLVSEHGLADEYNVEGVLSVGAPSGLVKHSNLFYSGREKREYPEGVKVLHLAHDQDVVSKIDALARPFNENEVSVDVDLQKAIELKTPEGTMEAHDTDAYLQTAKMFDADPHPEINEWLDSMSNVVGPDKETKERFTFEVEKTRLDPLPE